LYGSHRTALSNRKDGILKRVVFSERTKHAILKRCPEALRELRKKLYPLLREYQAARFNASHGSASIVDQVSAHGLFNKNFDVDAIQNLNWKAHNTGSLCGENLRFSLEVRNH